MYRAHLVIMLALAIGCRGSAPAAPDVQRVPFVTAVVGASTPINWRVPQREGQLSDSQLVALAPRIARLRAVPDTLSMDVTDSLQIAQLVRVFALDDEGAILGEIRRYEFSFRSGLTPMPSGAVRSARAGTGIFGASIPRRLPGEFRTRGPAQVWVLVSDSTGAGARMLQVPKGTLVISGIVRDSLGQPLAGASVQAMRSVLGNQVLMARAITDAEGRYRLDSLPAGQAILFAAARGYAPLRVELTLVEAANITHDLQLTTPPIPMDIPLIDRRP